MAWNPCPEVAAARDFGKKFNASLRVIVYMTKDNRVGLVTYGETKNLCDETKALGEAAYDAFRDAVIEADSFK